MPVLKISDSKDSFVREGRNFFYLADTVWFAFSHARLEEWEEYLIFRRMQGFNALQIIVLPALHDMSESILNVHPFRLRIDGGYDYDHINDEYFQRAEKMVAMACDRGFIPVLAPLWCNYIPGTWAAEKIPGNAMPFDSVIPYIENIAKRFAKYHPVYLASGDTKFESQEVAEYYRVILKTIKETDPDALITMHLNPQTNLPEEFEVSTHLDFYMYQSGHCIEDQYQAYTLAQNFYKKAVKRPVVNGEPCYDGCGHGFRYGRFGSFDVRKALWQSLLSGAKAGFTYGAHGVWNWHRKDKGFNGEHFSSMPLDWRTALELPGAWEASFAKWVFEAYALFDLEPRPDIVSKSSEIRPAVSGDYSKLALYIPYAAEVEVDMDLSEYTLTLVDLQNKFFLQPDVQVKEGTSTIKMHSFNSDVLLLGIK